MKSIEDQIVEECRKQNIEVKIIHDSFTFIKDDWEKAEKIIKDIYAQIPISMGNINK